MAISNLLRQFGVWTTVLSWHEPSCYRARVRGDLFLRLSIAIAVGIAAAGLLLGLFAINRNPPPAWGALFGFVLAGGLTAVMFLRGGNNASGRVRVCEEGIIVTRVGASLGHMQTQEQSWPYDSITAITLVPGEAIGKPFSLLFISSPGGLDMLGVPRRIAPDQLVQLFAARGVRVQQAENVPPQFTQSLNIAIPLASLAIGVPLLCGGLGFYLIKVVARGAQVAALPRNDRLPRAQRLPNRLPQPNLPHGEALKLAPVPPAAPKAPSPAADVAASLPPSPPPALPKADNADEQNPRRSRRSGRIFVPPPTPPDALPPAEDRSARQPPDNKAAAGTLAKPAGVPVYIPPKNLPGEPTQLVGGPEGWQFETFDAERKPVVGFRCALGTWAGQRAVGRLDPVFTRNPPPFGKTSLLIGRDGYVVGGVQVVAGDLVNAVRVIFVRQQTDGSLAKSDFYLSDWIGDPGERKPTTIGDGQTRIIGICGRRGLVLNALALVLDKTR